MKRDWSAPSAQGQQPRQPLGGLAGSPRGAWFRSCVREGVLGPHLPSPRPRPSTQQMDTSTNQGQVLCSTQGTVPPRRTAAAKQLEDPGRLASAVRRGAVFWRHRGPHLGGQEGTLGRCPQAEG